MHRSLRLVLSCFLLAALLLTIPVFAAAEQKPVLTTRAAISTLNVEINGETVDQQNGLYPLLNYKDITYFPLTWNYGQALGFSVVLAEDSLTLTRKQAATGLKQDLLPASSTANVAGSDIVATIPAFAITLQGQGVDAAGEWPFLLYKEITYMPFTWDYATALGISFTFDAETSTLSIVPMGEPKENETTLAAPLPQGPTTPTDLPQAPSLQLTSLLENGHQITVSDIARLTELNKNSALKTEASNIAFEANFSFAATDLTTEPITGTISGAWDAAAKKIHISLTPNENDPALVLPGMQMFIRPLPENEEETQIFIQTGDTPWESFPLEIPMLSEQLALGMNAETTDEEALETAAKALEDFGLDSLAKMVRNPEDTTIMLKLFGLMEFEETIQDGKEIVRLGYVGDIRSLCEAMDIDLTKVYTKIMGLDNLADNPLYAEMSPEELAELQAILEQSIAQTVAEASKMQIAFAIDFDAASSMVQQYTYRYLLPIGYDTIIMEMIIGFGYDEETAELKAISFYMDGNFDGGIGFEGLLELTLDTSSAYDWSVLDKEIAAILP